MKEKIKKISNEMKNSTKTAIVAAFSFLIGLSWKDVITEYVDKITQLSPIQGKLISAFFITIVCVLGILLTTKILEVKNETN
jgi:FtsH-binding integral membrane protein